MYAVGDEGNTKPHRNVFQPKIVGVKKKSGLQYKEFCSARFYLFMINVINPHKPKPIDN